MKIFNLIFIIAVCLVFYFFTVCSTFAENSLGNIKKHIESNCKEHSTTRGELDVGMYNGCVEHQKDGLDKLKKLRKKYGKFNWYDSTEKYCINQWTKRGAIDIFMVYYTMNRQIEGYLDVEYFRKQGISSIVNECLAENSRNEYIDWALTSYCIKLSTEKR